jgi:crotonobetainyl-CoA:carnitine CoA-transferase CaiB-like acyl-CoA transferase
MSAASSPAGASAGPAAAASSGAAAASTAARAPLAGLRVLDLSTVVAGPFGSEILGYLGADVIRIDAPSAAAPLVVQPAGTPVSEPEGFTWALARNKRSICLDLKSDAGRTTFLELVRRSDVVYDNFRPGVMQRLGLDVAALRAVNPRIVCCSITGFGTDGPWAGVGAYDVAVQALGGSMSITGTGREGDIPCRLGVPIGDIGGALYAVIGTLAALAGRDRTGAGQAFDVSLLDVQLAMNTYRVPQTFGSGMNFQAASPRRGGAGATPYGPFQCADGAWVVIGVASNFWKAFCTVMERPQWVEDPRFATLAQRQANQRELELLVEARFREDTAAAWESRLVQGGVPAARVNEIHEAFAHPQAQARSMLARFEQPTGRVIHAAASPLRFAGEPPLPQRAPVGTGENTEEVLRELALASEASSGSTSAAGAGASPALSGAAQAAAQPRPLTPLQQEIAAMAAVHGPLAGTLVLELCGDEPSGTLGTQILADLGATVLKVERPPAGEPAPIGELPEGGRVPPAIAYAFGLNRNKRSVCLDLKSADGLALMRQLAQTADVVYDNHKPGTMARLGLDAAALRALKPSLVCCSVSGYGQDGPWASQPAYDATVQAIGGAMSITGTGEPGTPPVRWGNPIGGIGGALYAAIGILAALRRRDATRQGAALDIALFDVQLAMQGYRVPTAMSGMRYAATPRRGGNGAMPYGPFLAGDGRWFVLGITGQFWAKACEAFGHPEWVNDPRIANEALRRENEPYLNALVSEALSRETADEWQRRFVALGIPGAKVVNIREAFDHPHVALRHMLVGFGPDANPLARRIQVAGNPIRFAGASAPAFTPVPGLGADTRTALTALGGLSPAALAAQRDARVVWWPAEGTVYERPSVV